IAAVSIVFAIFVTVYIGKWLKAESDLTLLLGIGTGVCGAAAIAATAPIIKAKAEDTAIGIGIIALVGTVFSIAYTILLPVIPASMVDDALWSGRSLHERAHVALAAEPAGEEELATALLAKISRVFLLVTLLFVLIFWVKHKTPVRKEERAKVSSPCYL